MWIFLGGDVEVNSEDEIGPGEVQVHGQSHLQQDKKPNVISGSTFTKAKSEFNTMHRHFYLNRQICLDYLIGRRISCSYHVSLLSTALLDPAELSERQLSGDGGGQRKLVVGTSSSLQFQTWEKEMTMYVIRTLELHISVVHMSTWLFQ